MKKFFFLYLYVKIRFFGFFNLGKPGAKPVKPESKSSVTDKAAAKGKPEVKPPVKKQEEDDSDSDDFDEDDEDEDEDDDEEGDDDEVSLFSIYFIVVEISVEFLSITIEEKSSRT